MNYTYCWAAYLQEEYCYGNNDDNQHHNHQCSNDPTDYTTNGGGGGGEEEVGEGTGLEDGGIVVG